MTSVSVSAELIMDAASNVATIGETLNVAHLRAAGPTGLVTPAAADEVSASIAHLMSTHGQDFQEAAVQVAAFHDQFVQTLKASAESYSATETAAAATLAPAASPNPGLLISQLIANPLLLPEAIIALSVVGIFAVAILAFFALSSLGLIGY